MTGHGVFPKFQTERFGKDDSCICKQAIGTIDHIIKDCVLWDSIRENYFGLDYRQKDICELLCQRNSPDGIKLIVQSYFDWTMDPPKT